MFRKQFTLAAIEERGLRELCSFVVIVYIKAWFTAPSAIQAPRHDLILMKTFLHYKVINSSISKSTSEKLHRHLWYLSEENIGLSLFDAEVSIKSKREIVSSMTTKMSDQHADKINKRSYQCLEFIASSELADFTTSRSVGLFESLKIKTDFLDTDPSTWEDDHSFKTALAHVKTLQVVNDIAERGVALIKQFNKTLTKDEDQL